MIINLVANVEQTVDLGVPAKSIKVLNKGTSPLYARNDLTVTVGSNVAKIVPASTKATLDFYSPCRYLHIISAEAADVELETIEQEYGAGSDAYDPKDSMLKVKSTQKKWRDSFNGAQLNGAKWDKTQGAGMTVSVAAGQMTLATGTTINSETIVTSKEAFTVPFKAMVAMNLSQRIANQEFYVELVSVDPDTLVPDDQYCAGWLFDGTSATQAKYQVKSGGMACLTSGANTIATSATMSVFEVETFSDECWFHQRPLDTATGRNASFVRHQQIPDPNALYKLRIRAKNLGTAPASNTNLIAQFAAVQDYAELTTEITASRGSASAGQGLPVLVAGGSVGVSGSITVGTMPTPTNYNVNSAATTNGANVKNAAGTIMAIAASNTSASIRYLKLYNKATAPVVGTDIPVVTIPLAAGQLTCPNLGNLGIRFATGIGVAITAGAADNDAAAIAASEVKLVMSYI